MRKFAIFNYSGKSANKGGPAGYLQHLFSGFNPDSAPDFICMTDTTDVTSSVKAGGKSVFDKYSFLYEIKSILSIVKKGITVRRKLHSIINNYDIIHIHDSESVLYVKFFAAYKGKIVLTSHRPEPLADEVINSIKVHHNGKYRALRCILNYIEKYSYNKAHAFIFPSKNAAEIYTKFPGFIKNSSGKPIEYLITGLCYRQPEISKKEYFSKYKIDLDIDKQIVSYIGRHNYIKGYDRVISSFETIKKNDASVIVAGAMGNMKYPIDADWIELGYINDAMNLMSISDIILIPNRNTYFDLVIIEALSLGKIVISSNTGGNLDIAKECSGLVLFENDKENSCKETIEKILLMPKVKRKELENSSRRYYEENCTPTIFATNYLKMIEGMFRNNFMA